MLQRAYSVLTVKASDAEQWVIEGMASTPTPDRSNDIVEPFGAKFSLPMPLLWQHDSRKPIGHVEFAKPTKAGIPFKASIKKASEFTSEVLRERALEAWESVKSGLVRGVSIGFREVDGQLKRLSNGGLHFLEWEWLELSLVTIPDNAEATISRLKSIDTALLAALGHEQDGSPLPGASGYPVVKLITPKPKRDQMNIAEQITGFENTRAAKAARRSEIQEKAMSEGRSKDDAEREEFDTISDELKSIDRELVDLRVMEKEAVATAKVVDNGIKTIEKAGETRGTNVIVRAEEKLEKGIEFARFAMCVAASEGNMQMALALAQEKYPQQQRAIEVLKAVTRHGGRVDPYVTNMKAAVAAGTTTETTWAAPLLAYNTFSGDFVDYLRPKTIIGQFGQNGIPSLRQIPFNVHIKGQTSGGTGYWVGEGKPKPVTKFDFNDAYHGFYKVAVMAALTEELIRFSDPSAERLVRDALAGVLIAKMDADFVDPAKAIDAGVSPASITNGVNAYTSSGDDGDAVRTDVASLWQVGIGANLPLSDAVYITTPAIALQLSLMMNPLGNREFGDVSISGGRLLGVPVIVSNHVPAGTLILVYASEIWLSDDGTVTVDASREASIQMLDNPTNTPVGATAATSVVSMFQTDSVALRAHRFINWSKRRASAVALVEDVSWGGALLS